MKPNQVPNQGQSLGPIVGRNMGLWLILEPKLGLNYQTNYKETKKFWNQAWDQNQMWDQNQIWDQTGTQNGTIQLTNSGR